MYKSNKSAFSPINQNIFLSKSHVLKFLKKKLRYSHIEKIYSFTVAEWKKSESDILNLITKNFNSAPLAMICRKADLTVASGCALANIPMIVVSSEQFDSIENGKEIQIDTESTTVLN